MNNSTSLPDILPGDRILRPKQSAEKLGLALSTFYKKISDGEIDPPFKIGPRASGHLESYINRILLEMASKQSPKS